MQTEYLEVLRPLHSVPGAYRGVGMGRFSGQGVTLRDRVWELCLT